MRTRGEVHIKHEHVVKRADDDRMIAVCGNHTNNRDDYRTWEENIHNAEFIAMCFNTADALDEAGYDGEKAIREFPELVKALKAAVTDTSNPVYKYGDALTFANRIRKINDIMQVAFDKIRGDK